MTITAEIPSTTAYEYTAEPGQWRMAKGKRIDLTEQGELQPDSLLVPAAQQIGSWLNIRQPVQVDESVTRQVEQWVLNDVAERIQSELSLNPSVAEVSRHRVVHQFDDDEPLDLTELLVETRGMNRKQRHELSEHWLDRLAESDSPIVRKHLIVRVR